MPGTIPKNNEKKIRKDVFQCKNTSTVIFHNALQNMFFGYRKQLEPRHTQFNHLPPAKMKIRIEVST